MENVRIYQKEGFGELRVVQIQNEPWFVAADVCRALEVRNNRDALERLDADEKGVTLTDTPGGSQKMSIVSESGLYSLVLSSRKPEAKLFKRWITHEVIPSIRKNGAYLTPEKVEEVLSDPDTIIRLASQLKQEREERKRLAHQVAMDAPKVRFAESVSASADTILISDLAKLLKQNGVDIGRDRLFARLRAEGYLCASSSERNMPTQYAMNLGLFQVDERTWCDPYGVIHTNFTTRVTGKGQRYFIRRYCNSNG